jgi:hypothetical protein
MLSPSVGDILSGMTFWAKVYMLESDVCQDKESHFCLFISCYTGIGVQDKFLL